MDPFIDTVYMSRGADEAGEFSLGFHSSAPIYQIPQENLEISPEISVDPFSDTVHVGRGAEKNIH